jgi:hypothetical protein
MARQCIYCDKAADSLEHLWPQWILKLVPSYGTDFHDIASGKSGSFSAIKGYDLVTGWDSPNGQGLIKALVAEK